VRGYWSAAIVLMKISGIHCGLCAPFDASAETTRAQAAGAPAGLGPELRQLVEVSTRWSSPW
jgi:hypothetical protein